jgi:hypothetical protein
MINNKFNFHFPAMATLLIFLLLSFAFTGCYTIRIYHDTDMLRENHDGEIQSVSMPFTDTQIGGPAQVRAACPSGASLLEIEQTMTDGMTHYLSLGMYSPNTVRVWCKRSKR